MRSTNTKPHMAEEARVCVTGWDFNRPDPFPGTRRFYWMGWGGGADAQRKSVASLTLLATGTPRCIAEIV